MNKKLSKKKLEQLIEETFYKYSYGVQINIMNLGTIFRQAKIDYEKGLNLDDSMKAMIEIYGVN